MSSCSCSLQANHLAQADSLETTDTRTLIRTDCQLPMIHLRQSTPLPCRRIDRIPKHRYSTNSCNCIRRHDLVTFYDHTAHSTIEYDLAGARRI
jgi:hypothetical protein